jgi:hypothetical protein
MELQDLPANEYNNEAGDLNKYDALKALYPTPAEISKEGKNSAFELLLHPIWQQPILTSACLISGD